MEQDLFGRKAALIGRIELTGARHIEAEAFLIDQSHHGTGQERFAGERDLISGVSRFECDPVRPAIGAHERFIDYVEGGPKLRR